VSKKVKRLIKERPELFDYPDLPSLAVLAAAKEANERDGQSELSDQIEN
jgi:hypothetical protein